MPWSGRLSCALLFTLAGLADVRAADPTPTPTPKPTPIPNLVDLSKFKGRYRGNAQVSLDSGALYIGRSEARISVNHATSAKVAIQAAIEGDQRTIAIGNTLTFTSGGVVRGRYLAPGVLAGTHFDGLYTATLRRITFSGTYKIRNLTGRFTGSLTTGKRGRFTLRYLIFPGESAVAAYAYQYSGRIPR